MDDEITDADRMWVAAKHSASALLHRVDPRRGLTDADYQAVAQWLNEEDLTQSRFDDRMDTADRASNGQHNCRSAAILIM